MTDDNRENLIRNMAAIGLIAELVDLENDITGRYSETDKEKLRSK